MPKRLQYAVIAVAIAAFIIPLMRSFNWSSNQAQTATQKEQSKGALRMFNSANSTADYLRAYALAMSANNASVQDTVVSKFCNNPDPGDKLFQERLCRTLPGKSLSEVEKLIGNHGERERLEDHIVRKGGDGYEYQVTVPPYGRTQKFEALDGDGIRFESDLSPEEAREVEVIFSQGPVCTLHQVSQGTCGNQHGGWVQFRSADRNTYRFTLKWREVKRVTR